jgi:hypothetical protein
MSGLYSYSDYLDDPFLATDEIGNFLRSSALRLFLGAGASKGFGLPEWKMLIARVLGKDMDANFVADLDATITDLRRLIDPVDDGSKEYVRRVQKALYNGVRRNLLKQLQKSPLLLAVAALITGMHRGRIDSVITYNYDDLLEQYLSYPC